MANREYRYLDGENDRRALIDDIRQVRRDVLRLVDQVPREHWYEPRYHGQSFAAMLGHLQMMDSLSRWLIQLGVLGVQLPISDSMLNGFNDVMGRVFRQRVVETTVRGIQKQEDQIADFIMRLPVDRFSRTVYHPALSSYLTVEQAIQELFLFHWRDHLQTMRLADDVHYEPPSSSGVV